MSTTETGKRAESVVAAYLRERGFVIRDQNWRTKWCEIDVVAEKATCVYFVEVKFRQSIKQGDGLAYITSKKLQQMQFAAELWVQSHSWQGEYCLAVAAVLGEDYTVTDFFEL